MLIMTQSFKYKFKSNPHTVKCLRDNYLKIRKLGHLIFFLHHVKYLPE